MADSVGLIGKEVDITGEIKFEGSFRIEGHFNGSIQSKTGTVSISDSGSVSADIQAEVIIVEGNVEGELNASAQLQISKTGQVKGKVITNKLVIDEGGIFEGNLEMSK